MAIPNSDAPVSAFPGVSDPAAYYSTGAGGSPTALPDQNAPVLESAVVVSVPGQSSQVTPDMTTVHLGDSAAARFGPTPPGGDPLTGIVRWDLTATGAGNGSPGAPPPLQGGVASERDRLLEGDTRRGDIQRRPEPAVNGPHGKPSGERHGSNSRRACGRPASSRVRTGEQELAARGWTGQVIQIGHSRLAELEPLYMAQQVAAARTGTWGPGSDGGMEPTNYRAREIDQHTRAVPRRQG